MDPQASGELLSSWERMAREMEWLSSPPDLVVNSPRRTLSLLRERRARVSITDPDEKSTSRSGFAREHGPKPSEVYGFVGSITTVIATGPIKFTVVFFFLLNLMAEFY